MKKQLVVLVVLCAFWLGVFAPSLTKAQETSVLRVVCLATMTGWVDYPNTYTFTQPAGGFLKIYKGTEVVAVWAPGQWSRIERTQQ